MSSLLIQQTIPFQQTWSFPLSDRGVSAELHIHGSPIALPEIRALQRYVSLIESTWSHGTPGPRPEDLDTISPGDIVQLAPSADDTFGGLLLRVMKTDPLRGYILLPRRGGSMEAWVRVTNCQVRKIGALRWNERWGYRYEQT